MNALLALSRVIDAINDRVGRAVYWLILAAVLISAANAIVRKAFDMSSNAFLEVQWYLFSGVFLLCAGYTLLKNEHIRIDVVAGRFTKRTQTWIDVFGTVFFLFPMVALILYESWPWFVRAWQSGEVSPSAGGLILWPAKILVPVGFALLALQGLSELIKRIGFLMGIAPDPTERIVRKTAEEELAEEILRARGERDIAMEVERLAEGEDDAMIAFITANMAPLMFAGLVVFLLLGYPVAFALAANGIVFGIIGIKLGLLAPELFGALPERIWGVMSNDTLLAIPFFTFMGLILERSGMAEDLLETIGQLFGPIRGGLAYAVIFVGALLAATTGVVAASVIAMGLISLPIMLRYGYDRRFASGTIAASGTLAQIIPPSLVLIIMADQLGRSVGDMYAGAFIPGIVLAGLYASYTLLVSIFKPAWVPALPTEARTLREPDGSAGNRSLGVLTLISVAAAVAFWQIYYNRMNPEVATDIRLVICVSVGTAVAFFAALISKVLKLGLLSRLAERVVFVLIPPLALIFLVLGTIFLGVATPTEGGAMGAAGALIMAVGRGRLSMKLMRQAMDTTAKLTAFVVFILIGARIFSLSFYGVDGHKWVEHLLLNLPGGQLGFLIVVNILVFVLAFFLDFFELSFIVIPLLGPVADKLGIDLIWFGVLLGVNMQTSFMHPPFGFALFYLRSVAPAKEYLDKVTGRKMAPITTGQIYWGAVPYVIIQLIMVTLVIVFPQMVMVYKDDAPTVDPTKIEINIPSSDPLRPDQAPPGEPGKDGAKAPSADPLENALQQQQDADKAGANLQDAFKK